jgi:hypothetical protein
MRAGGVTPTEKTRLQTYPSTYAVLTSTVRQSCRITSPNALSFAPILQLPNFHSIAPRTLVLKIGVGGNFNICFGSPTSGHWVRFAKSRLVSPIVPAIRQESVRWVRFCKIQSGPTALPMMRQVPRCWLRFFNPTPMRDNKEMHRHRPSTPRRVHRQKRGRARRIRTLTSWSKCLTENGFASRPGAGRPAAME